MKNILIIFAFLASVAFASITYTDDVTLLGTDGNINYYDLVPGGGAYTPPAGARSWWKFDGALTNGAGKIVDSTGNGNTATPDAGGKLVWNSTAGGVAEFPNSRDGFFNPDNNIINSSAAATIVVWCYFNGALADRFIILDDASAVNGARHFSAAFPLKAYKNGVSTANITSPINEWFLVGITWNDGDDLLNLYTNGYLAASISQAGTPWTATGIRFGERPSNPTWDYYGYMDDVMIYNSKAFTPTEMVAHYNGTKATYGL
jgi:hypothetical protein